MNFEKLRKKMVEEQIIGRDVKDEKVIKAMLKVPRERFVSEELRRYAYEDGPLEIGEGQTISQPYMVAKMTELLNLKGNEKVLEIGTGSGYQTAILAEIAKEICTIERIKILLDRAKKTLNELGYRNIKFKLGDGTLGWEEEAPFDRIIITAAAPSFPEPLKKQLKINGIAVLPEGTKFNQWLVVYKKIRENEFLKEKLFLCAFVPLLGKYGFKENS